MKIENTFTIPAPPETAWPLLLDVPTIAPCLPGAEITEVLDPQKFRGRATVKLGPLHLAFEGLAEIVDIDPEAMTARVVARGNEKKGRGNASATVEFALVPDPSGARVNITTDLHLAGAIAQYGRGARLLQTISDELIGQFATSLEAALSKAAEEGGAAPPAAGKPISGVRLLGSVLRNAIARKPAKS